MTLSPDDADLLDRIENMTASDLDSVGFGVIGFDADENVAIYNRYESGVSGMAPERVIGKNLFIEVAPCTNNYLVAERFRSETPLDEQLDYVFTLRMKPTPVRLRLLADLSARLRYMIVIRNEAE